jgi:hypothetical protein
LGNVSTCAAESSATAASLNRPTALRKRPQPRRAHGHFARI